MMGISSHHIHKRSASGDIATFWGTLKAQEFSLLFMVSAAYVPEWFLKSIESLILRLSCIWEMS